MKKLYTLIFATIIGVSAANATIHNVSAGDNFFSPASVSAVIGDTIRWNYSGSNPHTTTSQTVPGGAASWNANLNSSSTSFDYKVTVAGSYTYFCSIHGVMMSGSITVSSGGTGIADSPASMSMMTYPNPFRDKVTITHKSVDAISVFNMVGELVTKFEVDAAEAKTVLDLSAIPAGVYFVNIIKDGNVIGTRRVVKG